MFRRVLLAALASLAVGSAVFPAAADATRGLRLGLTDSVFEASPPARDVWLDRSAAAGAQFVLLGADWASITPNALPSAELLNPGSPSANWAPVDVAVRAVADRGLTVVLNLNRAPGWAEGASRPGGAEPGVWRPNVSAFAAFAQGAARRYSGTFPDPLRPGQALPAIRYWQIWTEPNLGTHLAPQWQRRRGRWNLIGPGIYRTLLNGAYDAIKSVSGSNVVITAGTAPFGDPSPGVLSRSAPAAFWRNLLCIRDRALRLASCPQKAKFDILAHHPFSVGAPARHALNADDVSVPDLAKLTRPLRKAERTGRVLPRGRKRVWVTELWWDSNPPDPDGVPAGRHARWLEQAFYLLWLQGVDAVTWFKIVDEPANGNFSATFQSGLYLLDGRAKPALTAYSFPFVTERTSRTRVRAWGRAPAAGTVLVQKLQGASWRTLRTVGVGRGGVFLLSLPLRGGATLRAVDGGSVSVTWPQS